jgi:hypothetical protein
VVLLVLFCQFPVLVVVGTLLAGVRIVSGSSKGTVTCRCMPRAVAWLAPHTPVASRCIVWAIPCFQHRNHAALLSALLPGLDLAGGLVAVGACSWRCVALVLLAFWAGSAAGCVGVVAGVA